MMKRYMRYGRLTPWLCNTSQAHCIADQIELYVRYMTDKITNQFREPSFTPEAKEYAIEFCKMLRGDIFVNGKAPSSVAAAIVYISAVECNINICYSDFRRCFNVSRASVKNMVLKMRWHGLRTDNGIKNISNSIPP